MELRRIAAAVQFCLSGADFVPQKYFQVGYEQGPNRTAPPKARPIAFFGGGYILMRKYRNLEH